MPGTRDVYVPPGYPRDLHVKNYREPKVSTVEKANNLRGLQKGWYVPIDEAKLQPFLLATFNFDIKAYLKHILPVLLMRELVQTTPETLDRNRVFDLQLVHKRGRDHDAECLERQLTFDPRKCTELNVWTKPDNEDWPEGFDPTAPVETEFLEYILVTALGEPEMQRLKQHASLPKPKKRKTTNTVEQSISHPSSAEPVDISTAPAAKKQKKAPASQANADASASTSKTVSKPATKPNPTKRHGKTIQAVEPTEPTQPEVPIPPVKKGFQLPRALVRNPSMLSELASQSSQGHLSRSTSFQSFDSAGEPSHRPPTSLGLTASQDFRNEESQAVPRRTVRVETSNGSAASDQVPSSSQLDPSAGSWSFSNIQSTIVLEDERAPNQSSASFPDTRSVQTTRPAIFNEESPSPEPIPVSAGSSMSRRPTSATDGASISRTWLCRGGSGKR
jgi:hypothetical protein